MPARAARGSGAVEWNPDDGVAADAAVRAHLGYGPEASSQNPGSWAGGACCCCGGCPSARLPALS